MSAVLAFAIPGGILATLLFIFRPLAIGLLRAALMVLEPRQARQKRRVYDRVRGAIMLNRLANEVNSTQPNLASELRSLASRG